MRSIFDTKARAEVIGRIKTLSGDSTPRWGSMNVYQMLKHCAQWEEMLLGKREFKRTFLGRLFGRIALKGMLKDEPLKPKMPTVPEFKALGNGDVSAAKAEWIALLWEHSNRKAQGIIHPFFGKLTADEAGRIAYKHIDHHLRQFGA